MSIFISYRRGQTNDMVGRIDDRLRSHFGHDFVFRDVEDIPVGADFVDYLSEGVAKCDVLVAVIGEDWSSAGALASGADFVRIEVEAALSRKIPVVPVLVGGATMPAEDALPRVLAGLSRRQAAVIDSGTDFDSQVRRLIAALESHLPKYIGATLSSASAENGRPLPPQVRGASGRTRWIFGAVVAVVAIAGTLAVRSISSSSAKRPEAPPVSTPAPPPPSREEAPSCVDVATRRHLVPTEESSNRRYRLQSIAYSGPSPATPFSLTAALEGPADMPQSYKSGPNCDLNELLSEMIEELNRRPQRYRIERMDASWSNGTQGQCGRNTADRGMMSVSYFAPAGPSRAAFCDTCLQGRVRDCVDRMLRAVVDRLNGLD